jgi:hypothetical protein
MRKYLLSVAAIGIACAMTAGAQDYGRRYDPYYGGRDAYARPYDRGGRGYYGGDIIGRTMSDLNRAGMWARHDKHDRKRVDHAQRELMKFQDKWARGKFDSHPLDEAIDEMKDLVGSNHVSPRDREMLMRDVEGLRAFRASGGYYGRDRDGRYRGGYQGYDDGYRR